MDPVTPPPVRRIAVGPGADSRRARDAAPNGAAHGHRRGAALHLGSARLRAARPPLGSVRERMRVESVWLAYGENWVVRDVSLPVRQGEVLALIGASGSGKTTLLRSLNRLTEITAGAARAGRITLDGQDIHELEVNELRRRVSMVFQQPNPFPMSIFDNVAYALAEQSPARGRRRRRRSAELEHAVSDALRTGRAVRRGRRRPRPLGADALRRPAAAAVHRARARRRAGGAAARRAVLGARPDLHGDDRGADRGAARERGDRDRHAQPPAGVPRGRPRRVHAPRRARRVRDPASRCSTAPPGSARATTSAGPSGEAVAALVLAALALTGCETTAEKSAKLEKIAKQRSGGGKPPRAGPARVCRSARESTKVRVCATAVLHSSEGTAAVVTLRNVSAHHAARGPDRDHGQERERADDLYPNNAPGLAPALVPVSLLPAHRTATWVDDQVPTAGGPASVSAMVGEGVRSPRADSHARRPGRASGRRLHHRPRREGHASSTTRGSPGNWSSMRSPGGPARSSPPGAPCVPQAGAGTSTPFQLFFIGDPQGARLEVSAPASTLG